MNLQSNMTAHARPSGEQDDAVRPERHWAHARSYGSRCKTTKWHIDFGSGRSGATGPREAGLEVKPRIQRKAALEGKQRPGVEQAACGLRAIVCPPLL